MIEAIAYIALMISLVSMSMKSMIYLRAFHALSSLLFGIYGICIDAFPLIIGGSLFLIIHSYHIIKMLRITRAS
ncbi:MAG: hypothetical protein COC01_05350 [Bacteroidetes bacterium]|nr:YgjV family protein [Bacteroidia bacterium]PCH67636.1 MAG: hypothetical protein COC01_05350 [Bacteroidota bacterium]